MNIIDLIRRHTSYRLYVHKLTDIEIAPVGGYISSSDCLWRWRSLFPEKDKDLLYVIALLCPTESYRDRCGDNWTYFYLPFDHKPSHDEVFTEIIYFIKTYNQDTLIELLEYFKELEINLNNIDLEMEEYRRYCIHNWVRINFGVLIFDTDIGDKAAYCVRRLLNDYDTLCIAA